MQDAQVPRAQGCAGAADLVRGKIALFTIDMLVNMLARAGKKVALQTRRKKAA